MPAPFGIYDGKVVHGPAIAALGRFFVPAQRLARIGGEPAAALIERAEPVLRHRFAALSCLLQPMGGLIIVYFNAIAIGVFQSEGQ